MLGLVEDEQGTKRLRLGVAVIGGLKSWDLTNLNPKEPDSVDKLNNYLAFVLFHLNGNMQNVRLPHSRNYLADPK